MELLERIKILAAEKGVSLAKMERECGFSKNSVMKWDKSIPSGEKLLRAARYFGVSADYLLGNSKCRVMAGEELPDIYFHFLKGAKELNLTEGDMELLLDIASRFKREDVR
jgi:transcriptional regulator with XRE-family HTH domain